MEGSSTTHLPLIGAVSVQSGGTEYIPPSPVGSSPSRMLGNRSVLGRFEGISRGY